MNTVIVNGRVVCCAITEPPVKYGLAGLHRTIATQGPVAVELNVAYARTW